MYQSGQSQPVDGALPSKTPVSLLQELCMRRGISPKYDLLQIEGPVHEPTFVYRVTVGEFAANGSGQTKKKAKHAAAKAVLDIIIQGGSGGGQTGNNQELSSQIASPYDDGIPGNPVGALQELCMSRRWPPPTYELTGEEGFPHERTFSICCVIGNYKEIGAGKSKKLSKRQAAHKMMQKLKDQPVEQPPMNVLADDDDEVIKESINPDLQGSRSSLTKKACLKVYVDFDVKELCDYCLKWNIIKCMKSNISHSAITLNRTEVAKCSSSASVQDPIGSSSADDAKVERSKPEERRDNLTNSIEVKLNELSVLKNEEISNVENKSGLQKECFDAMSSAIVDDTVQGSELSPEEPSGDHLVPCYRNTLTSKILRAYHYENGNY